MGYTASTSRTSTSGPNTDRRDWDGLCWTNSRSNAPVTDTPAWSGRCWTGTSRRSRSPGPWKGNRWTAGPAVDCPGGPCERSPGPSHRGAANTVDAHRVDTSGNVATYPTVVADPDEPVDRGHGVRVPANCGDPRAAGGTAVLRRVL